MVAKPDVEIVADHVTGSTITASFCVVIGIYLVSKGARVSGGIKVVMPRSRCIYCELHF